MAGRESQSYRCQVDDPRDGEGADELRLELTGGTNGYPGWKARPSDRQCNREPGCIIAETGSLPPPPGPGIQVVGSLWRPEREKCP